MTLKISINLLPAEFTQTEAKRIKFIKIQSIGVLVILTMVFLSSLTVALAILQSQNVKNIQTKVSAMEQKVSDLKGKQVSLLLIENRLAVIDQYFNNSSKQVAMLLLLNKLLPDSITVSSTSISKTGEISLLALFPDVTALDLVINNLTENSTNGGKIEKVSIDSISRGKDGAYRVSMGIDPT